MSIFGNSSNPFSDPGAMNNFWVPRNGIGSSILENNPTAGYQRFLDAFGQGGDNTPMARWFNNQYGRVYNQYQAALPEHGPDYRFLDFLKENGGGLWNQYQSLPASAQGQNPSQYAGRLRWVM